MDKFPETRISLILRLAHPQDVFAWQEFVDIYAPAVYALALRHGLQPADAEDLTQETLFGVARAVGRFQPDRNRARFRTWLARITRNLIADHFSGKKKRLLSHAVYSGQLKGSRRLRRLYGLYAPRMAIACVIETFSPHVIWL